jgi:hypothetical protein
MSVHWAWLKLSSTNIQSEQLRPLNIPNGILIANSNIKKSCDVILWLNKEEVKDIIKQYWRQILPKYHFYIFLNSTPEILELMITEFEETLSIEVQHAIIEYWNQRLVDLMIKTIWTNLDPQIKGEYNFFKAEILKK